MLNLQNIFVIDNTSRKNICVKFASRFADVWRGHNLHNVDLSTLTVLR